MTISTQNLSLNAIVPTELHFHTHFISRNEICKANEIALTKKGVATTNAAENVPKPISQKLKENNSAIPRGETHTLQDEMIAKAHGQRLVE